MKRIASTQNQAVKNIVALQSKAKARKETKSFVVEGLRELQLAFTVGFEAMHIYWCPEILVEVAFKNWIGKFNLDSKITSVSTGVYRKMVMRDTTEGVVGVLKQKDAKLENWQPKSNSPIGYGVVCAWKSLNNDASEAIATIFLILLEFLLFLLV